MMMRVQPASGEIAVSQPFKDALSKGEANILVNEKAVKSEDWRTPIVLPEGDNKVQIKKGDESTPTKVIHSDKDNPTVLAKTPDGDITYTPLRRRVAESVIALGGKSGLSETRPGSRKRTTCRPAMCVWTALI